MSTSSHTPIASPPAIPATVSHGVMVLSVEGRMLYASPSYAGLLARLGEQGEASVAQIVARLSGCIVRHELSATALLEDHTSPVSVRGIIVPGPPTRVIVILAARAQPPPLAA